MFRAGRADNPGMPLTRIHDLEIQPLSANRVRALALLAHPTVDLGELVSVAETDPALTLVLLRMANSASSSPTRSLSTARAAVIRLGALTTRRAIATTVLSTAFVQLDSAVLDIDGYWRHALAVALIADLIAAQGDRSEAFTVGLLHDVGCLAMAAAEAPRYQRVRHLVRSGVTELDAERIMFGHDHAYYSQRVVEHWGLDAAIAEAVGDHHDGTAGELARLIVRARRIAAGSGIGDGRSTREPGEPLGMADRALLAKVHGPAGLAAQIDAMREAIGAGRAGASRPASPPQSSTSPEPVSASISASGSPSTWRRT